MASTNVPTKIIINHVRPQFMGSNFLEGAHDHCVPRAHAHVQVSDANMR